MLEAGNKDTADLTSENDRYNSVGKLREYNQEKEHNFEVALTGKTVFCIM